MTDLPQALCLAASVSGLAAFLGFMKGSSVKQVVQSVTIATGVAVPFLYWAITSHGDPGESEERDTESNSPSPSPLPDLASPLPKRKLRRRGSLAFSNSHFEAGESPARLHSAEKVVVVMVGLPARGKSYVSGLLVRYLNWFGCYCQIFNAGNMRRMVDQDKSTARTADFFDHGNKEAKSLKEKMAMDTLDDLLGWLEQQRDHTAVGIFDATNTTIERRQNVFDRIRQRKDGSNIKIIFLENICNDIEILERNYQLKLKNKDYKDMHPQAALLDFKKREANYKAIYEPVADTEDGGKVAYIKLIDAGAQFVMRNHHYASVHTQVGGLLQRVHLSERTIWLALVGQTDHDVNGLLGGDPLLTEQGMDWARRLERFLSEKETCAGARTVVLTGSLKRDIQMRDEVAGGKRKLVGMRILNEMCAGDLDSMSYEQIEADYPEQWVARQNDKLRYRFPGVGGESYQDVIQRLHEVIFFLETQKASVMVVVNKAVLRVLWAYFNGKSMEEMPFLAVPGHTQGKGGASKPAKEVIELRRTHSGFETTWLSLGCEGTPTLCPAPDEDEASPIGAWNGRVFTL